MDRTALKHLSSPSLWRNSAPRTGCTATRSPRRPPPPGAPPPPRYRTRNTSWRSTRSRALSMYNSGVMTCVIGFGTMVRRTSVTVTPVTVIIAYSACFFGPKKDLLTENDRILYCDNCFIVIDICANPHHCQCNPNCLHKVHIPTDFHTRYCFLYAVGDIFSVLSTYFFNI